MSKLVKQCQHRGKALELRLEEDATSKYSVILAGLTLHFSGNCVGGRCEGGRVENYIYAENQTFKVNSFSSLMAAENTYHVLKEQYID